MDNKTTPIECDMSHGLRGGELVSPPPYMGIPIKGDVRESRKPLMVDRTRTPMRPERSEEK